MGSHWIARLVVTAAAAAGCLGTAALAASPAVAGATASSPVASVVSADRGQCGSGPDNTPWG